MSVAIAIVGRPNVGKSTLFNRLTGRRQAIVHGTPGVTRDRLVGRFDLEGRGAVSLIDTGGLTGNMAPGDDPLGLNAQVEFAVMESDALLLVVDGKQGLAAADEQVMARLRGHGLPIVVVVNKADTRAAQEGYQEFYALGADGLVLVSAEHGTGLGALHEEIAVHLPVKPLRRSEAPSELESRDRAPVAVAVVGRPNVGKSSLVNRLLGEERTLVSPTAGTTRDPVDSLLQRSDGPDCLLVDTAGIRRRSQVQDAPEELAVMLAKRQIERAELVVVVIDASRGVTTGDLAIADAGWQAGRAAVIACNKWDLLDDAGRERLDEGWRRLAEVFAKPPRVNVSALTGRGVAGILPALDRVRERQSFRVSTSELNRVAHRVVARHQPPAERGRPWRFHYAAQVQGTPPTFLLFANRRLKRGHAYRKYLENQLRREFDLDGIPLRLVVRERGAKTAGGTTAPEAAG